MSECRNLSPDKSKAFLHIVKNGSGAHPVSCIIGMGGGGLFLRREVKRAGLEADNSPPSNAKVKHTSISTSTPPYAFVV
jgi:hypothetical protein